MSTAPTRALVLAAGRGERLGALTGERPKCLVTLAGRALLDWQLDALRAAGISEVAVVRGYRGDRLTRRDVSYFDNHEWATSNMVVSMRSAAAWLERAPCVIAYGDVVYHAAIVVALAAAPGDVAIAYDLSWRALWQQRFARPEEDAESLRVRDGRVVDIGRKGASLASIEGQYMGLVKTTPAGWRRIDAHLGRLDAAALRRLDVTTLLRHLIDLGEPVAGVPISGRWCEVDHATDIRVYERALAAAGRWSHDWRD